MHAPNPPEPGRAPVDLRGLRILVTRPAGQGDGLCRRIQAAGGQPLAVPTLTIEAPTDTGPLERAAATLGNYDLILFASPNAVRWTVQALDPGRPWPAGVRTGAVGRGTARAMEAAGIRVDYCPAERYDTEGLLALPALQDLAGRRVALFRGEGGRELLPDTLRARGAHLDVVPAYRRTMPRDGARRLAAECRAGLPPLAVVTSAEAAANLARMARQSVPGILEATALVVPSERVVERAQGLGFRRRPVVVPRMDDATVMECVAEWYHRHRDGRDL